MSKYKSHKEQIEGKECFWALWVDLENIPGGFIKYPIEGLGRKIEDWEK